MTGLVEFLTARLDEDERIARTAIAGPWAVAPNGEVYAPGFDREVQLSRGKFMTEHLYVTSDSEGLSASVLEEEAVHIARHNPARVLAEVAAKRSLIGEIESYEAKIEGEWGSGLAGSGFGDWESALRFLAAPYADHPEFDESWRVAEIVRDRETT